MTPEDESTTSELTDAAEPTDASDATDTPEATDGPRPAADLDDVDDTQLQRSREAIDEAREAAHKVSETDAFGEDATGAGELPPFADSTEDAEKPTPEDPVDPTR